LRLTSSGTRFSNDEEMNIVLLRLIEYLGHPNPFTCGVAYTEVYELSRLPLVSNGFRDPSVPRKISDRKLVIETWAAACRHSRRLVPALLEDTFRDSRQKFAISPLYGRAVV